MKCEGSILYVLAMTCLYILYFLSAICVAVDMYIKISRPLKYMLIVTRRISILLVIAVWILALAGGGVALILYKSLLKCEDRPVSGLLDLQKTMLALEDGVILPMVAFITGLNLKIIRIAGHQARAISNQAPQPAANINHKEEHTRPCPVTNKSTRYFKVFLWSFVLVWLPPVIIMNISFALAISSEKVKWFVDIRNAVNTLGLCQMLYGMFTLTLIQEQFREIWKSHWQTLQQKFQI